MLAGLPRQEGWYSCLLQGLILECRRGEGDLSVKRSRVGFKRMIFVLIAGCVGLFWLPAGICAADEIPMGPAYQGPKAMISVGDFTVQARGAPQEIGDGFAGDASNRTVRV